MNRKLTALLCAGMMLTGMTGCFGQSSQNPGSGESSAADPAESSTADPGGAIYPFDTEWEPADESLNLPQLKLGMTTWDMCRRAVVNQGNRARLADVMKRAKNGEAVTVACIGGSITQGTGASSSNKSYEGLNIGWWAEAFPEAAYKLKEINAGIGATGSYIGVHRLSRDVLAEKPDVVIVEFSVNDTDPQRDLESYDSLVRRILESERHPAVILLFMTQDDGTSLYETHKQIGEKYDLPMISYKNAVLPEISKGTFAWKDISGDNIHPNDNGHGIAAELLWEYYNSVLANLDKIDSTDLAFRADPVGADRYHNAEIIGFDRLEPTENTGFAEAQINSRFPHNLRAETAASISFNVTCGSIGVLYQRTITGKSGNYDIFVDGEKKTTIDGNFIGGWGSYAEAAEVFVGEESVQHEIRIAPSEGTTGGLTLLGLMTSTPNQ